MTLMEPKEHPNYPGYVIYPDGRIWSNKRNLFLKACRGGQYRNYLNVGLGWDKNKKKIRKSVHRLVLETFVGPCPEGKECAHLNGDPFDNRIENLAWLTHRENCSHQVTHGTRRVGSKHQNAKLDETRVAIIKDMLGIGIASTKIAHAFGVAKSLIAQIKRGEIWTHVK